MCVFSQAHSNNRYIFTNLTAQQNINSQQSIKQPLITPSYISITTLQTNMCMNLILTIILIKQVNNNLLWNIWDCDWFVFTLRSSQWRQFFINEIGRSLVCFVLILFKLESYGFSRFLKPKISHKKKLFSIKKTALNIL